MENGNVTINEFRCCIYVCIPISIKGLIWNITYGWDATKTCKCFILLTHIRITCLFRYNLGKKLE